MTPRPTALSIHVDGIPAALIAELRWVVWKYVWRQEHNKPGDWTKPLFVATAPAKSAKSTDPTTWRSFDEALAAYEDGKCDGIGFVLGDGWVGFDSDDNTAPEHVALLNTYTERSPSNKGIHAVMRGTKPGPRCRVGNYELYAHDRYLTVTGHHVDGTPTTVEARTAEIASLYRLLFPDAAAEVVTAVPGDGYARAADFDDELLWAQMVGGHTERDAAVYALYRGETSAYGSHSEADLALCCHLAWWTNYDAARIDRMFRQSGLYRETKWERASYRQATIGKAMAKHARASAVRAVSSLSGIDNVWEL